LATQYKKWNGSSYGAVLLTPVWKELSKAINWLTMGLCPPGEWSWFRVS